MVVKTTVIGVGQHLLHPSVRVKAMAQSNVMRSTELALVDINPGKAEQMGRFCQRINRDHGGT
jgi:alpha-galactosidase/6-phospho-beta-glucosidase family protein